MFHSGDGPLSVARLFYRRQPRTVRLFGPDAIQFIEADVERALGYEHADVLLLHDWPEGVIDPVEAEAFEFIRRSTGYDSVGNAYARMLVDLLEPRLVLCGHLHKSYRAWVGLPFGNKAFLRALDKVGDKGQAVALFRVETDGTIHELMSVGTPP